MKKRDMQALIGRASVHRGLNSAGKVGLRLWTLSGRLLRDRQGIGAIEFALLVPVLLMLYLGALEVTVGFSMAKRATKAAGTVADIITQQASVDKTYLAEMPSVAASILAPYDSDGMTLKITGIAIDSTANAKLAWSWSWEDDDASGEEETKPCPVTSDLTVPDLMKKANTFLVRAELCVPYRMFQFAFLPDSMSDITINRDFFYRQRVGDSVTCGNC